MPGGLAGWMDGGRGNSCTHTHVYVIHHRRHFTSALRLVCAGQTAPSRHNFGPQQDKCFILRDKALRFYAFPEVWRREQHTRAERRFLGRRVSERRKMAKREGSSASGPRTRSKAAEERREAEEVESIQRLDKLPQEVWEKILDHLESDDLFPLALSCRYFRQKQKELVERKRREQSGWPTWKPRLAFKTALTRWPRKSQQASADYLRFCSKEKVSNDIPNRIVGVEREKAFCIRILAAHHGHLPLLQELLEPANELETYFTAAAGESPFLQSLVFFVLASDLFLAFSSSQRAEADWRPCSG